MLYNPTTKDWDWQTIDALGLPRKIFTKLDRAGALRGTLRPELAAELGINQAHFAAVGTHDTASAVAAIPGTGSFAFCSSGTWSLFGVETDEPILSDAVRDANFSNEGTIQGGFRPLKNIMGLWLIQECRRDWQKAGQNLSWNDIVEEAKKAEPFRSIIDPDYGEFFAGGRMVEKIQTFCRETNQAVPETVGQIARCIYESLALKYRWALERLEEIKGQRIDTLNIVGGGCQNTSTGPSSPAPSRAQPSAICWPRPWRWAILRRWTNCAPLCAVPRLSIPTSRTTRRNGKPHIRSCFPSASNMIQKRRKRLLPAF